MIDKNLTIRGTLTFEPTDPPRPPGTYVYQRVAPGLGNVAADPTRSLQLRARVIPTDPATPSQLAYRFAFAEAVAEWQSLSPAEKKTWQATASKEGLPGYQYFLSHRMREA